MLTLGRNYSSPVCSSPGPGQYLTPWRVPAYQKSRQELESPPQREIEEKQQQRQQHTA